MKNLETELEKFRNDMSAENFMNITEKASEIPQHLLKVHCDKNESGKVAHEYDDVIKNFALSLHLKSRSAYRYIRSCFGDALPSTRTVQRWCSKVDASPGFNRPALDHLTSLVLKAKQNGKSLACSLTVDEMAVRKYMEFKGNNIMILSIGMQF